MSQQSFFGAYAKICRLEYIRGEAPAVFIPALITATSFQALTALAVLEAIAVFALLYVTGFMVNALTDRELDLKYDSFKHEIGEATNFLGPAKVKALLVLHIVAASLLALHLSLTLGAPWLFGLVMLGVFLSLAYSLPPLHLKVRGVAAHAVALALSAFAIPFLFLYYVAAGTLDASAWAICAAFTLTHYGLTYTNQAYDFDEDLKEGVLTPPVRLGLRRSLRISAAMVAVGLPLMAFSLISLALSRESLTAVAGPGARLALALVGSALLAAGYSVPLRGLARMIRLADAEPVESDAVPKIRAQVNYSKFHASGIASMAVFGLLLFAATLQASVMIETAAAESVRIDGVDASFDRTAPGGPHADLTVALRNLGDGSLPAGFAWLHVEARESEGGAPYFETTVPIAPRLVAGSTAAVSVENVPIHLVAGGCTVTVRLLIDGNHDGAALVQVDSKAVQVGP